MKNGSKKKLGAKTFYPKLFGYIDMVNFVELLNLHLDRIIRTIIVLPEGLNPLRCSLVVTICLVHLVA